MAEQARQVRVKVGFPWIISVETDDILSLFRRRRTSRGPFLLIVRGRGLALDTAFGMEGDNPILWPPHAQPHQLWYFHRTEYRDELQIVSVANGLALDAKVGARPLAKRLCGRAMVNRTSAGDYARPMMEQHVSLSLSVLGTCWTCPGRRARRLGPHQFYMKATVARTSSS
jgi:hypothetical protein